MKILVIDDSTINNILLQDFLENNGFNVLTALSGYEALDIIENQTPDLILLDLMMPGISGFDVLRIIRRRKLMVPTIIVSAYNDIEKIKTAKKLGACNHLKKPIDFNHLLNTIESVIEHA